MEKIAYSITHPAYLMPREPKLLLRNIQYVTSIQPSEFDQLEMTDK